MGGGSNYVVGIKKVPDTAAQDGMDQDVGIEDDHLSEMASWIG